MQQKHILAIKHAIPSLVGIARRLHQPAFARVLRARVDFYRRREFKPLTVPEGFVISTPAELVSYWALFVERELDHPIWLKAVKKAPRPFVLDIGANYGIFARYVKVLNPSAEITGFEPQPQLAKFIGEHIAPCHSFALSDNNGTAELHFAPGASETASLCEFKDGPKSFSVPTRRLDELNLGKGGDPLLAKIDVDGGEHLVIKGGVKILNATPYILIEILRKENVPAIDALFPNHTREQLSPIDYFYHKPSHAGGA